MVGHLSGHHIGIYISEDSSPPITYVPLQGPASRRSSATSRCDDVRKVPMILLFPRLTDSGQGPDSVWAQKSHTISWKQQTNPGVFPLILTPTIVLRFISRPFFFATSIFPIVPPSDHRQQWALPSPSSRSRRWPRDGRWRRHARRATNCSSRSTPSRTRAPHSQSRS